jgi:hypothetical protein
MIEYCISPPKLQCVTSFPIISFNLLYCFSTFLWFLLINKFMHVAGIFIDENNIFINENNIFINENNIFINENTYFRASGVPCDKASSPYLHVGNTILYQVFITILIILLIYYFNNKLIYYV